MIPNCLKANGLPARFGVWPFPFGARELVEDVRRLGPLGAFCDAMRRRKPW